MNRLSQQSNGSATRREDSQANVWRTLAELVADVFFITPSFVWIGVGAAAAMAVPIYAISMMVASMTATMGAY
ncbi:MAG: hypothetical protein Q8O25_08330 [Sulfurisoma sp.]|nr:hypothetical protein [Sulfurisoma sp.]